MLFLLCAVLFILLFFLSRYLTESISAFFYQITHKHTLSIQLLAILFLPGVIIHELSHWLIASMLFVPTGQIEFFPQAHGNTVKLGSVQVGKTDPIRRFFIGIAPSLVGLAILLALIWFLTPSLQSFSWQTIIFLYSLFEIGNTMFSSKKDLEGALIFLVLTFLFITLLFFLKVPLQSLFLSFLMLPSVAATILQITQFLLIAVGIDCVSILVLGGLSRFSRS